MRKYNNPRLLNTVVSGTGMKHPIKPHVIIGETDNGFLRGDLMDANAIGEFVDQRIEKDNAEHDDENVQALALQIAGEIENRETAVSDLQQQINNINGNTEEFITATQAELIASTAVNNVIGAAPEALNTLEELATALASEDSAIGSITQTLATKADKSQITALYGELTRSAEDTINLQGSILSLFGGQGNVQCGPNHIGTTGGVTAAATISNGATSNVPFVAGDVVTLTFDGNDLLESYNGTYTVTSDTINGSQGVLICGDDTMVNNPSYQTSTFKIGWFYTTNQQVYDILVLPFDSTSNNANSYYNSVKDVTVTIKTAGQDKFVMDLFDEKVDKEFGKGLSTNDYTTSEKNLVAKIAQPDWNSTSSYSYATIKNKPTNVSAFTNDAGYITQTPVNELQNSISTSGIIDGIGDHQYVEIGGIKWATMNIGANTITDSGLYFSWGNIDGHSASESYQFSSTKYNSTNGKQLSGNISADSGNDAARINWGGAWRMPTDSEFQSLIDNTNTSYTEDYQGSGIAGQILTDKNDSSKVLFFPQTGHYEGVQPKTSTYYWSSTFLSSTKAYGTYFVNMLVASGLTIFRYYGYPIRPVFTGDGTMTGQILGKTITDSERTSWNAKANAADLATVATSGSYNDLTNKPINVSTFTNDAGYLTLHQDISGKANSADLATVATSGSYNDLTDKPTISVVSISQSDYDTLVNNSETDSNTLYIIQPSAS